jgi:hypothetical protein
LSNLILSCEIHNLYACTYVCMYAQVFSQTEQEPKLRNFAPSGHPVGWWRSSTLSLAKLLLLSRAEEWWVNKQKKIVRSPDTAKGQCYDYNFRQFLPIVYSAKKMAFFSWTNVVIQIIPKNCSNLNQKNFGEK